MLMNGTDGKAGSGSASQWYGSADLDPYQNVTDPQHWLNAECGNTTTTKSKITAIFKQLWLLTIPARSSPAR
jgi:hypothetical protein